MTLKNMLTNKGPNPKKKVEVVVIKKRIKKMKKNKNILLIIYNRISYIINECKRYRILFKNY